MTVPLFALCAGALTGAFEIRRAGTGERLISAFLCAGAFLAIALRYGPTVCCLRLWALSALLLAASRVDLEQMIVPDAVPLTAVLAFFALLPFAVRPGTLLFRGLTGGLLFGGGMLLLAKCADRLLGRQTLGGGDLKLFAVLGLYLGTAGGVLATAVACTVGLTVCAAARIGKGTPFPFAPSVALGGFAASLLTGDAILPFP